MAHDVDELRAQIDARRSEISGTVEQIENRIRPGRIVARRRDRMRRTITDWKDSVFGNDEPDYPRADWYRTGASSYPGAWNPEYRAHDDGPGMAGRAADTATSAADAVRSSVHDAPSMVRRQTRGNPLAAGLVAAGAGWLVGSVLPGSAREHAMAQRIEPALADAAAAVRHEGEELAGELREPVRDAVDEIKQTGMEAVADVRDEAKHAAGSVTQTARGDSGGASPG